MSEDLLIDVTDGIGTITLNRPDKLNAFTEDMLFGVVAALDEFDDRDDVSVVILAGAGRAFCSGGDVSRMGDAADRRPHVTKRHIWRTIQAVPKRLARFEKPVLCAVQGPAVGGGMDLALACDIRVAATSARFCESYCRIGLLPGGGGGYFLPRIIGRARSLEMFWTAAFVDAEQALEIGLVSHVYPDEDLMSETRKLAAKIVAMPPYSVRQVKRLIDQSLVSDMTTAFDLVSSHIAVARASNDHVEAITAFREKRPGIFTGQ